jgi:hypothetical protein
MDAVDLRRLIASRVVLYHSLERRWESEAIPALRRQLALEVLRQRGSVIALLRLNIPFLRESLAAETDESRESDLREELRRELNELASFREMAMGSLSRPGTDRAYIARPARPLQEAVPADATEWSRP